MANIRDHTTTKLEEVIPTNEMIEEMKRRDAETDYEALAAEIEREMEETEERDLNAKENSRLP